MQTFDPNNGQIYNETTTTAPSMISKWKHRTTGRPTNPQAYRNPARGVGSLRDMALRNCCWNVPLFMPEALEAVGWWYAGMIYRRLKETDTLSFAAWTLFQQAFPGKTELNRHFTVMNTQAADLWLSIVESLRNLSPSVTTLLCAPGLTIPLRHLLSLIAVPSLTTLVHLHPSQAHSQPLGVPDMRVWARAVQEKNALPALRVLVLSNMANDAADVAILRPLLAIPALKIVGIARSSLRRTARAGEEESNDQYHEVHEQWDRLGGTRGEELSDVLRGTGPHAGCPMAERMKKLYNVASDVSRTGKEDHAKTQLSLTCYGDRTLGSHHHVSDIAWYIRTQHTPETANKRAFDTQGLKQDNPDATKRRVRQKKQQNVGSMLDMFG